MGFLERLKVPSLVLAKHAEHRLSWKDQLESGRSESGVKREHINLLNDTVEKALILNNPPFNNKLHNRRLKAPVKCFTFPFVFISLFKKLNKSQSRRTCYCWALQVGSHRKLHDLSVNGAECCIARGKIVLLQPSIQTFL